MIVIPGPSSKELGEKIARELDETVGDVDHRIFSDGESYFKILTKLLGKTVVVVQTTSPYPDTRIVQLCLIATTARDLGANRIIAIVPYLAYSRQDKRFTEGEALSLDVIMGLFEESKIDDLVVVDIHNEKSVRKLEKRHRLKVHNLSAIPLLARHLRKNGFYGAFSLSPDRGAIKLAEAASKILEGNYGFFEKTRDRTTGDIKMHVKDLDISEKKAVIFDDIISSGSTMAYAIKSLKVQGAFKVAAACSHALLNEEGEKKLQEAGVDSIISTDSINTPYSKVTIAGLIADYLKNKGLIPKPIS